MRRYYISTDQKIEMVLAQQGFKTKLSKFAIQDSVIYQVLMLHCTNLVQFNCPRLKYQTIGRWNSPEVLFATQKELEKIGYKFLFWGEDYSRGCFSSDSLHRGEYYYITRKDVDISQVYSILR
jgi:hypothetical protein